MMAQTKGARHQRIREILGRESIRSQTDLAERLLADGVDVTQATLSRDLVELGAVKVDVQAHAFSRSAEEKIGAAGGSTTQL